MISPDKLERYRDFVDPERTGAPYDPRQGLERLMGILSPDPKGIVLAAMDQDWYGGRSQLQARIFSWLEGLGLPISIWPLSAPSNWNYIARKDENGEIVDGSLVELGAVIKKAEDPFQVLYQRSVAGGELAISLVQQSVRFVSRAREITQTKVQGKTPHKFDSMWRVIGAVNSSTGLRRPLAIFDTIDFLVHNPGKQRKEDLKDGTDLSEGRLNLILESLGNFGIIDYISPKIEKEGQPGRGWSIYTLVSPQSTMDLNPDQIYSDIRNMRRSFTHRTYFERVINYIKGHPSYKYESGVLVNELKINPPHVANTLSLLADLGILERPDPGFKGGERASIATANDLTHIFYDLVCAPARALAETLSPLPLKTWNRSEVVVYLDNYDEERSQFGPQRGDEVRSLLLNILQAGLEMKISHIVDLYNEQSARELKDNAVRNQLRKLLDLGEIEQPKPKYYRIVNKQDD